MKLRAFGFVLTLERKPSLGNIDPVAVERIARSVPAYKTYPKACRIRAVRDLCPGVAVWDARLWVEENFR